MRSRIQFFTLFSITAALFAEEAIDPERAANTIILSEAAVQNIGIEIPKRLFSPRVFLGASSQSTSSRATP